MDLKTYLKGKDRAAFAILVGTTKNYINLLACGARRPSPDLALKIEQMTNGEVTRDELLFPELHKDGIEKSVNQAMKIISDAVVK